MHEDLRTACLAALDLKREDAAAHARKFSWRAATEQFLSHLHPREQAQSSSSASGALSSDFWRSRAAARRNSSTSAR